MLKALFLQHWYSLSDEGLEALADRLSFRRFCGFALDDETPHGKTVCRFRLALVAADLPERLFAELDRQLDAKGLFVKTGTSTAVLPSRQDLAVVTLRKPVEFGTKRPLWQIEER